MEFGDVFSSLVNAPDVDMRWQVLTHSLAQFGMDQINYGVLDTVAASRLNAPVRFLSTMSPSWLEFYSDQRLDANDPHVSYVREGFRAPYRWGESALKHLSDDRQSHVVALTVEAGLRAQLSVSLLGPFSTSSPIAGFTLGSSLKERDLFSAIAGKEMEILTAAHIFHTLSIGEILRNLNACDPLTTRERDSLRLLADGHRIDAIADKLAIARVTVELHLRSARRKLRANTLPQAVARALAFGEISLG